MPPQAATTSPSTQRDLLELAVAYLLIMATIWTPNPTQRILYWLAFAWIVGTTWARREDWTALGLGRKGLLQSLWIVAVALCLSAITIYIAWRTGSLHRLHGPTPIFEHGWAYIIWSLMQEFILQSYFLLRFLRLLPNKASAIIAAAGIFALAHLPNPILTPITLIWGTISCILFLRYRNIYALGIAHGIMGLCIAVTVPNSLHHHMRVGLGYLRYHQRNARSSVTQTVDPRFSVVILTLSVSRTGKDPCICSRSFQRNQSDQSVSTEACVTAEAPTLRSWRHARP